MPAQKLGSPDLICWIDLAVTREMVNVESYSSVQEGRALWCLMCEVQSLI